MRTIARTTAHKELTTRHQTMRWTSDGGMVTIRKTSGKYIVRLEDFYLAKTVISTYATLPGALMAAETLRDYYL